MTLRPAAGLRVALVHHSGGGALVRLARGLGDLGHAVTLVTAHGRTPARAHVDRAGHLRLPRLPESLAHRRGFTGPLTHVPGVAAALVMGRYDVVHCFTPPDALAARWWRRVAARPVVFTCGETLDRASVADSRLRLGLLAGAIEQSDALLAADAEGAAALKRWMAADAAVVPMADAEATAAVYRALGGA